MATGKKLYEAGDLKVWWDPTLCQHSGVCARGMAAVFDPKRRPWIVLENGEPDAVRALVRQCPSGAIRLDEDTD
ncbi:MAG: (4Fe-4S)-binding protein [Fimbriimonadaceae bacterium]|nr:(4Fe-4S)-binding protein [Fimbriimonadaceae bacterium]